MAIHKRRRQQPALGIDLLVCRRLKLRFYGHNAIVFYPNVDATTAIRKIRAPKDQVHHKTPPCKPRCGITATKSSSYSSSIFFLSSDCCPLEGGFRRYRRPAKENF